MEATFSIGTERRRAYVVVRPRGELDCATAPALAEAIGRAAMHGGRVVVDLRGLGFMDTTGLRTLARADDALAARGVRLHLIAGAQVQLVVHLTGMASRFRWIASEQLD